MLTSLAGLARGYVDILGRPLVGLLLDVGVLVRFLSEGRARMLVTGHRASPSERQERHLVTMTKK